MGMLINRDGDIQAGRIEIELTDEMIRRANSVGATRIEGFLAVIKETLGVEIDEIQEVHVGGLDRRSVTLKSDWKPPCRR